MTMEAVKESEDACGQHADALRIMFKMGALSDTKSGRIYRSVNIKDGAHQSPSFKFTLTNLGGPGDG